MKRLIRAEALHLRSLRSTSFTAFTVMALTTLVVGADFSEAGSKGLASSAELLESFMTTLTLIPALGLALFAASRTAAEFRYATIAHRALAAPDRRLMVAAKLLVLVGFTLVVSAACTAIGMVAAGVTTSGTDPVLHLRVASVAEILGGTALFAALGVAAGFLTRNQTTAVLVVFGGWVFEKLLEAVLKTGVPLPYSLLGEFAQDEVSAGAALLAITAAAVATATTSLSRKDVI
jgi:hypothetical protein